MKNLPLDHIGVAVRNIEEATRKYQELLGAEILHDEIVASQKVKVRFLKHDNTKTELLEATDEGSSVARFIANRGEGLHHIAFAVEDINKELSRMKNAGYQVLQEEPILGAMDKLVFFIHPKSVGGILVEICQPRS